MRTLDLFKMCMQNLMKRVARTMMTVSGIVIGTCSVVVMISLGIGLNLAFDSLLSGMGDLTKIMVYAGYSVNAAGQYEEVKLKEKNIETIKALPNVTGVKSTINVGSDNITLRVGDYVYTGGVTAIDMRTIGQFGYELTSGSFAITGNPEDYILFGSEAAYGFYEYDDTEMLYWKDENGNFIREPAFDPAVDEIEILPSKAKKAENIDPEAGFDNGIDYEAFLNDDAYEEKYGATLTSMGVLKEDLRDYMTTNGIFIDISLARRLIADADDINNREQETDTTAFDSIDVKVNEIENIPAVEKTITDMGFMAYSMESQRQSFKSFTMVIQLVLGGLAGISLFVAAIGISNTMIMSITERTKEIGVMKVLGCSIGNIRTLFLMESGAIGLLGGIFGSAVSFGLANIINQIAMQYAMSSGGGGSGGGDGGIGDLLASGEISVIPLWLVLFALAFATMIGIISGFYPANRAVKISPLEAIRHD